MKTSLILPLFSVNRSRPGAEVFMKLFAVYTLISRRLALRLCAMLVAVAVVLPVHAGGDPQRGKDLSAVCASCHGPNGDLSVTPDIPVLAGQHYSYLVRSIKDYRSGVRQDLIMTSFVKDLSDQDIEDLAEWYARQDSVLHTPTPLSSRGEPPTPPPGHQAPSTAPGSSNPIHGIRIIESDPQHSDHRIPSTAPGPSSPIHGTRIIESDPQHSGHQAPSTALGSSNPTLSTRIIKPHPQPPGHQAPSTALGPSSPIYCGGPSSPIHSRSHQP